MNQIATFDDKDDVMSCDMWHGERSKVSAVWPGFPFNGKPSLHVELADPSQSSGMFWEFYYTWNSQTDELRNKQTNCYAQQFLEKSLKT
jgi:hypothetical protein